ncbi:hypothetical protein AAG570_001734 [Ranatra chinensis]|uniref:Uncharacterized protein n=1 Tax=Ranatra chinensis TaxID=642074 RepID=A0ABD0YBB4_9HEMI
MASKRRNMFHKNKTQETTEKGSTSFVIKDIESMGAFVEVAWVGPNLGPLVQDLTKSILGGVVSSESVVFLSYTPSELVLPPATDGDPDFLTVNLPPCDFFHHYRTYPPCRYNAHRIVKLAWFKLEKAAKFAFESLHTMYLEPDDYREMLLNYNRRIGNLSADQRVISEDGITDRQREVIWSVACDWMKDHRSSDPRHPSSSLWSEWVSQKKGVHTFNIGGIFPIARNLHISQGTYIARVRSGSPQSHYESAPSQLT